MRSMLPPGLPSPGLGACAYTNPFSRQNECKQYTGAGWTEASARENCDVVFAGQAGEFQRGGECSLPEPVGVCLVAEGEPEEYYTVFNGADARCETLSSACVGFAMGRFLPVPDGPCDGGESPELPDVQNGSLQSEAVLAMRSDAKVTVAPICEEEACVSQLVDQNQVITFTPNLASPTSGLIIYPGGEVDPRAYAVAAKAIARAGYFAVIVPMRANLAINGINRALDVIDEYPDIQRWTLAGHSLGGVVAAQFIYENPDKISGLALWASYPDESVDLSDRGLKVVNVYGTLDPRTTPEQVSASLPRLPTETLLAPIRAGNHSYFAWAGLLDGDVEAELINQKQQSDLVIGATLHLLARVDSEEETEGLDPLYVLAAERESGAGCALLQQRLTGLSGEEFPREQIDLVVQTKFRDFWSAAKSSPSIDSTDPLSMTVYQYTKQHPNPFDLNAPPIIDGELFCKLNTPEAVWNALDSERSLMPTPKLCSTQTSAAYDWALESVAAEVQESALGWSLEIEPDQQFPTGLEFMGDQESYVKVSPGSTPQSIRISSPTFRAGLDVEQWGRSAGSIYCKSMSYQNALWRIYARERDGAEPWTVSQFLLEDGPLVVAQNQAVVDDQVKVDLVIHEADGFIIIHEDDMGRAGVPIGQSPLVEAGIQEDITATLVRPIRDGEILHAMLHIDGNQNGVYDPRDNLDPPVERDGRVVMMGFTARTQ